MISCSDWTMVNFALENLKNGLMQVLPNGKVRVRV
jgi:hypothetical protein